MAEFEIKDKVFVVTGAAAGIGAGVVRSALEQGAKHVAILDILETKGKALAEELNSKFGETKAKFHKCDVTVDGELFGAFDATLEQFGVIDVVINNAGIWNDGKDIYKKEIEINFTATVTGTLKAIEFMRRDAGGPGGTVINIASVAALSQMSGSPIYFATKSAVLQFSNCIGMDDYYQITGVRVLTVCFGVTDTALLNFTGGIDSGCRDVIVNALSKMDKQSPESAVRVVLDAYRRGASGSTWYSGSDLPARDITKDVKEAYNILQSSAVGHVVNL